MSGRAWRRRNAPKNLRNRKPLSEEEVAFSDTA
jgi:hypothetical protein